MSGGENTGPIAAMPMTDAGELAHEKLRGDDEGLTHPESSTGGVEPRRAELRTNSAGAKWAKSAAGEDEPGRVEWKMSDGELGPVKLCADMDRSGCKESRADEALPG